MLRDREAIVSKHEGCYAGVLFPARLRGNIHSSHGGRKAHLNFELKDLRPPEAARQSKSDLSDFDVIIT